MRIIGIVACLLFASAAAPAQEVPVTGAPGASLNDLVGSPTLVTVVLKYTRTVEDKNTGEIQKVTQTAEDPNLRVVEVTPAYIAVVTEKNERTSYLRDSIAEIRVQGGKVERAEFEPAQGRGLKAEDLLIVNAAVDRAREIFSKSDSDQELKVRAATVLAVSKDAAGFKYLQDLMTAGGNSLETQLDAFEALYLAGPAATDAGAWETIRQRGETLINQGLDSGSRKVRSKAIQLAGLLGLQQFAPKLGSHTNDRASEVSAPACRALARLGNREVIPRLLAIIEEPNELKGTASIRGLGELGGEDVAQQMKLRIDRAESGLARFRMIQVLDEMGDPDAHKHLTETMRNVPTLAVDAAMRLAKRGDWDGAQFVRNRLNRREDVTEETLLLRARMAASLIEGGDPSAVSVFQELLRTNMKPVRISVCDHMLRIGRKTFLTLLQPTIETENNEVALAACTAAVALGDPDFRKRMVALRD